MSCVPYRYVALNISQQTPKLSQDLSDMSSKLLAPRTSPESHHVIDLLCVVSEDFSEFLGVDLEIIFGVQFDPIDLEDFGFAGSGGSDF